jgi:hypothetical protein
MPLSKASVQATNNSISILSKGKDSPVTIIQQIAHLPSILNPLLEKIIEVYQPQFRDSEELLASPEVEEKILFNSVKIHAGEIRDNCGYMALIEQVLDGIDNENPNAKNTFLWAVNKKYVACKKELFIENNIDPTDKAIVKQIICKNADRIIAKVAKSIIDTANGNLNFSVELIEAAQELIVCYGFINCKILEKPE